MWKAVGLHAKYLRMSLPFGRIKNKEKRINCTFFKNNMYCT